MSRDIGIRRRPRAGWANFWVSCLATAGLLSGCATPGPEPTMAAAEAEASVANAPPELQRLYRQVPLQGRRNFVLNQMRAGLAALEAGRLDQAASSFDAAVRSIETIYADNPDAERARLAWYKDGAKDFRGEAYERAMAYYYRGLIYLMKGDYQNARAAFRGGLLQDSFMEESQRMTADFGVLAFLEGWAGRCAGADRAAIAAAFAAARERNAALAEPQAVENILVLFETGTGPIKGITGKVIAGKRNTVLGYQPGAVPAVGAVTVSFAGRSVPAIQAEDLFFQAATRSGRWVEAVDQGRVIYRDTVTSGDEGAAPPPPSGRESATTAIAGLFAGLVGWVGQATADTMRTEADARHWDNLPGNILLATFINPAGVNPAARQGGQDEPTGAHVLVNFERGGQPQLRRLQTTEAGDCVIAWGHEVPAANVPDAAPYTEAAR